MRGTKNESAGAVGTVRGKESRRRPDPLPKPGFSLGELLASTSEGRSPRSGRSRRAVVPHRFSSVLGLCLAGWILVGPPAGAIDGGADLAALARSDLDAFAETLTRDASDDFERAAAVTAWFAGNFDWTATDYERRTVEQILERGGGNCAELARVTTATLERLALPMRRVREINLHFESVRRQRDAEAKVAELGPRASVFGRRHNDHVWIEIQDRESGRWFPADPSLGVVGEDSWIAARLGFGERFSLDPSSADMIAPFAVFAEDGDGGWLDRTRHYVIDGFDALYAGRLAGLPAWTDWVAGVERLAPAARAAFDGRADLHERSDEIRRLTETYRALESQAGPFRSGWRSGTRPRPGQPGSVVVRFGVQP